MILTDPITTEQSQEMIECQWGKVTRYKWLRLELLRLRRKGVDAHMRRVKKRGLCRYWLECPDDPEAPVTNHHKQVAEPVRVEMSFPEVAEATARLVSSGQMQAPTKPAPGSPERPIAFGKGSRPFDTKAIRAQKAAARV
jgi:hypothetical protein